MHGTLHPYIYQSEIEFWILKLCELKNKIERGYSIKNNQSNSLTKLITNKVDKYDLQIIKIKLVYMIDIKYPYNMLYLIIKCTL